MDSRYLAFLGVSAVLIVIPGPDMALMARNAFRDGTRGAWSTALGVGVGIFGWGAAAMLGVATLLAQSAMAFTVLKLAGAGYLLYLGIRSLVSGLRDRDDLPLGGARTKSWTSTFRQGALGNLLNPKAAAIFVTVIPQFIRPGDPAIRLAVMFLAFEVMIVGWLTVYGLALSCAGRGQIGRQVRRALHAAAGVVLVGFAVRLATGTDAIRVR